ncbi:MurR/RpiR family transcriptional regulator [Nitratireductor aquimarinus]|uniref:MurR/RpiR family transcriptional regulator n=1 Tax=Nitratireductor aquimarinus TaxID=889300 RepID=A0ABU4APU4_9HYPH|nr:MULTISPECIES: MurR/RpiR family transcriptional regulator [Alphaproteobacteria]MBY6024121.1 MurR/RpiR family transcriptional regulator [Nitratireductor sp. DP7N14-4]MBN7758835.1 MurR/RpiR family transcriptional regulator [Nitratireductor aquimarinus]MBN7760764.1 MurR/RpiR family transcriptional regulator [Nitratireductor aquibiodomus]MBN7778449.1 MurR/RpiR family transcriptional regulator [Nitratireductor pacificus]MBN7782771.1 MurR/RpiR family transcriptional regulator [Nitratireductor paci
MDERAPNDTERTVDIIARLQDRLERGRGAEIRLVESILADPHFAAHAPIAQIAERAGVSEPTITRLARALGFPGTRDMRFHLAQALAIGGAYLREPSAPVEELPLSGQVVAKVATGAHAALDLMSMALADIDLEPMARSISRASQILIYGTGGSSSFAAVELQNRLFRLGLHVTAHTDPQLQRMSASVLEPKAVVIGFSVSGQAPSVMDAVTIARQYGARAYVVTTPNTPLAEAGDALLPLTFKEDGNLYKPSSMRYALLASVDIIAMATALTLGKKVLEPLRRVRHSLASQNIRDPELPIGD